MIAESVKFKGHGCFTEEWAGFDTVKPINVIIGRNNTGKSRLLQLVEDLCTLPIYKAGRSYHCTGLLTEEAAKQVFQPGTSGGPFPGDHWQSVGHQLFGSPISWEVDDAGEVMGVDFLDDCRGYHCANEPTQAAIRQYLENYLTRATHALSGHKFRRLLADRDIRPEVESSSLELGEDGSGATNIIRRYLHSSNQGLPEDRIQNKLRSALDMIFGDDGEFSEIRLIHHDEDTEDALKGTYEIALREREKGLIALSASGSGLKTVLLVLLNLLVVPKLPKTGQQSWVFCFEELENNLHPAVLRRLFSYLEKYAVANAAHIFLTTHSSVALDFFGASSNAQIVRVEHHGKHATAHRVDAHFERHSIVAELGARPSDLLQANGIIWVEGPSDRVFLNRWIELFSDGEIEEGRDYQCAFYGGSLLARVQFTSEEEAEKELVNLFRVNSNIVVVCDSDKTTPKARVKGRVRRIRSEVIEIPGSHIWVTGAREIENYIPGKLIAEAYDRTTAPDPDQFESFFPRKGLTDKSYIEKRLNRKAIDKMELASVTCPRMTKANVEDRFDLKKEVETIIGCIRQWNQ